MNNYYAWLGGIGAVCAVGLIKFLKGYFDRLW